MSDSVGQTHSGEFLLGPITPGDVFVPEDFTEEDRMIADTADRFVTEKVHPRTEEVEGPTEGLIPQLLHQIGELGIFMVDVPEELDGLGVSKKVSMRVAETLGTGGSFGVAAIVQSGIGGLPIIFFGSDEQRAKYLPGIMSGETLTAYALTEPECGSDALAARTTAIWDEGAGVYVLNGTKQFITNAGFADLFITFAKVEGKEFTSFILESGMEGLSTGAEEPKMGLKGSSTRSLILENVKVPKENILGEIGKGHRIAFNVLNIGRLKLAPAVLGGSKRILAEGATYAVDREQFGRPLCDFGLIRQKLAASAARIYSCESMCYRTAAMIDNHIVAAQENGEIDTQAATVGALKEFAVECSINKVYASEAADWIVDEILQLHGGYGYSQEYLIERAYRDSRINRIWEGTNEINRMLITGTLLSRARKNELPLLPAIKKIADALMRRVPPAEPGDGPLADEAVVIENAKKMTLFVAGVAAQSFPVGLDKEQEILAWIADMVIHSFAMESAWLRTVKLAGRENAPEMAARGAAVRMIVEMGMEVVESHSRLVLAASQSGEDLRSTLSMVKKLTRRLPANLVESGRTLANLVVERQGYPFS